MARATTPSSACARTPRPARWWAWFFRQHEDVSRPVGVAVVSIGNLYTLENLHGRAALNHALFVCASRLRRCVPADVEMGRLGDDGGVAGARHVAHRVELRNARGMA